MERSLQIFGDSIMRRVIYDEDKRRYRFLSDSDLQKFASLYNFKIINNSLFGCTIGKGLELLKNKLNPAENGLMLLEYGGNDCDFDWPKIAEEPEAEHLPATPIAEFTAAYYRLIDEARSRGYKPILMNLPPLDAEKYFLWFSAKCSSKETLIKWLGDVQMIYRFQELYSTAITEIAHKKNCICIDIRSRFLDKHNFKSLLCTDGIHPNEQGHALILDAFYQAAQSFGLKADTI